MQAFTLNAGRFCLELGPETCIMGVLNTTPDSFSDGGQFYDFKSAVNQGIKLVEDGAHILDIGGESSRPFAAEVSEQEELDRVIPVIENLSQQISVPISIDTVKSNVAREALNAGASIINDISAFERDPAMADLAAEREAPVILMHMKGTPDTMQINPDYDDLLGEITDYLKAKAVFAMEKGIRREKIILDPGIGFGKTVDHNLVLMNSLEKITDLGFPVLIGPSRKSFIQNILARKNRQPVSPGDVKTEYGTMASAAVSILNGAHIVRVHDIAMLQPFVQIIDSIRNA